MDADALEEWLKKKPRTKKLRLTIEGEAGPRLMDLEPGRQWRPVVETVLSLDPLVIEALDANGKLLRAVKEDDQAVSHPPARKQVQQPIELPTPTDPESVRFALFAQLLADAYRHSTDVAFDKMVDLFEAVNARYSTMERTLDHLAKLLRKQAEAQIVQQPDDDLDLVKAFMAGQQQADAEHPTNGKGS